MIIQLPRVMIDQIAAGEVVVRPASVVKELVENSGDAGARHIAVSVDNALRNVVVTDDGAGMSRDDAQMSLQRHATSKIRSLDDLQDLHTRGFRGEALPSIAAVSRLSLTTRRPEDVAATRIAVEGGHVRSVDSAGAPAGSKVEVADLFYNTPARLKFLKSAATELGQITRTVVRQALSQPAVGFRLVNRDRVYLDLPAAQPLESRVRQLLGVEGDHLLAVAFEKYGVRIHGFVAKPIEARRDRRHQFFFVNGRPITHRTLGFSVQQAYEGLIMSQRFPVLVLFIDTPPDEVDVNVHPTKEEVRFREDNKIAGLVHRAVMETLHGAKLIPRMRLPDARTEPKGGPGGTGPIDHQAEFLRAGQALHPPKPPYEATPAFPRPAAPGPAPAGAPEAKPPAGESASPPRPTAAPGPARAAPPAEADEIAETTSHEIESGFAPGMEPRVLGQVANTYIVAEAGDELLLIDQHAAHERLLYLKALDARGPRSVQPLLVPISVEVRPADRPLMEELLPVLDHFGFEAEAFGGQTFVVRSVPVLFDRVDVAALVHDLLDELAGDRVAREGDRIRECVLTRLACHAAVKAGQRLQTEEMQRLLDELIASRLAFTCPHGRPTMIRLTRDQLDRQFKRK